MPRRFLPHPAVTHSTRTVPDRISIDPAIRFGKPCVRGTRLTVAEIVGFLATGAGEAECQKAFPQLQREDLLACLAYAAMLAEEPRDPAA